MSNNIAESAAKKIAEAMGFDADVRLTASGLTVAAIIAAEYEPRNGSAARGDAP